MKNMKKQKIFKKKTNQKKETIFDSKNTVFQKRKEKHPKKIKKSKIPKEKREQKTKGKTNLRLQRSHSALLASYLSVRKSFKHIFKKKKKIEKKQFKTHFGNQFQKKKVQRFKGSRKTVPNERCEKKFFFVRSNESENVFSFFFLRNVAN